VARYDAAHGYAHRDTLDRRGREIMKVVMAEDLSLDAALARAERDLRQNWQRYRQGF
jgi:hypothetical protein